MVRFILFIGCLVGLAYVLTTPPATERAFSANEVPIRTQKPLLTSWGPTLGSLRDGVGAGATQTAANTASGPTPGNYGAWADETAAPSVSDGAVGTAALAAGALASTAAGDRAGTLTPARPATVAALPTPRKQRASAEPEIDRIAAALPPQRRGLFGRALNSPRAQAPRATRQARAGQRNRGLFKRLRGRTNPTQRAWALGPAR